MIVLYGQDVRTQISYFGTTELKKASINRNELREIAVNNLTQMLPQLKILDDNGMYIVRAGGCYEASLILCKKFWKRSQFSVNGEMVIAVPSKDIILVTGSNDKKGMVEIKGLARKLHDESGFPLVTDLFALDSSTGMFRKFNPKAEKTVKGKAGGKATATIVKK
jgi:uncharacterized protein YtpQ (UPF0354 family)